MNDCTARIRTDGLNRLVLARHAGVRAHFACRWCLKGRDARGHPITTIFDLAVDRRSVRVHPGAVSTHSVELNRSAVDALARACAAGRAHVVDTVRLAFAEGPQATLGIEDLAIVYRGAALLGLVEVLEELSQAMR
ncbi:hypothetical protein [Actinokineospora sp. NBRC 105648]|uniref:hypothetical protein n=1 Tax=Actinokineospora sp. NBRC 105648 TaxID=3032206 RepID=UPI0024A5BD08|nr:hypothetical protein [Actinokineospora sp. NBRC 105648]GLZ38191.1 hypothetical protein Acsp05_18150 [Actinokineospora sp. NBRC 105648]